ncbi:forkhead box protein D3-like [Schistocerca serialis cubense]|uniref:forkhead box protein D3-like n=1 Tax=Schistocerca serialis cubense TaxID=2023355 RepID=UPI00214DFE99|nr:forkhead box protein D3-like [Schistocerca serialis cubense]
MLDPQYGNTFDDSNFFRQQCVEQPFFRSRGSEAGDVAVGSGATSSPAYPQLTRYEHSAATATSASPLASEIDSTDRAAPDSSHPGGTFCEDDVPVSDVKTSTDGAATLISPCGGTGNDRRGSSVGSSANGAGDTGSASTAVGKPPFQYEELIAMAIMKSPHRRATLSEINAYIASCFPYFDRNKKSWQSSIHCKLCFSKYFIKVPLESRTYKGKRFNYWMLDPQYEDMFEHGNFCQRQHAKQPSSSRSRGSEGVDVSIGGGGVSSSGDPHCASYEHSCERHQAVTCCTGEVHKSPAKGGRVEAKGRQTPGYGRRAETVAIECVGAQSCVYYSPSQLKSSGPPGRRPVEVRRADVVAGEDSL